MLLKEDNGASNINWFVFILSVRIFYPILLNTTVFLGILSFDTKFLLNFHVSSLYTTAVLFTIELYVRTFSF